jgi:electron transport complex protein RnfB
MLPGGTLDSGLATRIDALLPQTQCTRCGYAGCRPYAQAIAEQGAPINRCPPGGTQTLEALAALLGQAAGALDPACGSPADPGVAWIDAEACIGCARCLAPCPVDAIIGASRYLHTVQASRCTGCELCLASCPVDCIHMRARATAQDAPQAEDNRRRFEQHQQRAARHATDREALLRDRKRVPR